MAVGVHSIQFEVHQPGIDLFEPVLKLASETIDNFSSKKNKSILKIAGVCGKTFQALNEANLAKDLGYHAYLLSLAPLADSDIKAMIKHCKEIASVMPVIGFYLQPSVGERILPYEFWREFSEIENILAIKMAPFNRYQTFDVIRAVCEAGRENDIYLYTGNDDNIVIDLLTEYKINTSVGVKSARIIGGLLGHWAVWTKKAVELLDSIHKIIDKDSGISKEILSLAVQVTDSNAAFFDPVNKFAGCIPGIHEVLRRQGLMAGTWCLNPKKQLSSEQSEEIDRVYKNYPHLNDDEFIKANLKNWLE